MQTDAVVCSLVSYIYVVYFFYEVYELILYWILSMPVLRCKIVASSCIVLVHTQFFREFVTLKILCISHNDF